MYGGLGFIGGPATTPFLNDNSTGTTVNQLAKINSSGNAVNAATTDTAIQVNIVVSGAGTTGSASLAFGGAATCLYDAGGAVIAHYVVASTATAGKCRDAGATAPTSGWVVGVAQTTAAANTTGIVFLSAGYNASAGGGGSVTAATISTGLYLLDVGTPSVYVGCPASSVSLQTGLIANVVIGAGNTSTGSSTFNYCAAGAKNILREDGTSTISGELVAGKIYDLRYDGTEWQRVGQQLVAGGSGALTITGENVLDVVTAVVPLKANANVMAGLNEFDLQVNLKQIASPSAPAAGLSSLNVNSTSHQMQCTNPDSSSCLAGGGQTLLTTDQGMWLARPVDSTVGSVLNTAPLVALTPRYVGYANPFASLKISSASFYQGGAAAAGKLMRVGVMDGTCALLNQSASVAADTTGVKTVSLAASVTITTPYFYFVFMSDGAPLFGAADNTTTAAAIAGASGAPQLFDGPTIGSLVIPGTCGSRSANTGFASYEVGAWVRP